MQLWCCWTCAASCEASHASSYLQFEFHKRPLTPSSQQCGRFTGSKSSNHFIMSKVFACHHGKRLSCSLHPSQWVSITEHCPYSPLPQMRILQQNHEVHFWGKKSKSPAPIKWMETIAGEVSTKEQHVSLWIFCISQSGLLQYPMLRMLKQKEGSKAYFKKPLFCRCCSWHSLHPMLQNQDMVNLSCYETALSKPGISVPVKILKFCITRQVLLLAQLYFRNTYLLLPCWNSGIHFC